MIDGFLLFPQVVVLNMNAIYNHFSATGRRARRFQKVIEEEYQQALIESVWDPFVREHSDLEGRDLQSFVLYYQPTLAWWTASEDIEKLDYLHKKLHSFRDSSEMINEAMSLTGYTNNQ